MGQAITHKHWFEEVLRGKGGQTSGKGSSQSYPVDSQNLPSPVILLASPVASSLWQRRKRIGTPVTAEEGFLPLPAFLLAVPLGGGGLVGNEEEERRLAMGLVISMKD